MKKFIPFLALAISFTACEDTIDVDLKDAEPTLVVDAWLTHLPGEQKILLQQTRPYFDNGEPTGISGATVMVVETNGQIVVDTLVFAGSSSGVYTWSPEGNEAFGTIGYSYFLEVDHDGKKYYSQSTLNPVPNLDSISFRFEEGVTGFFPDFYAAEFWARDLPGEGDTYWIKAWKNGTFLNKPSEINIAYDAGFSQGAPVDNIPFIQPVRDLINPFEEDPGDEYQFFPPYLEGDSVYVQIQSINYDVWFFLVNVISQTNRPGGFSELFATPLTNVYSNIIPEDENERVVGIFSVSAVSGLGRKLDEEALENLR